MVKTDARTTVERPVPRNKLREAEVQAVLTPVIVRIPHTCHRPRLCHGWRMRGSIWHRSPLSTGSSRPRAWGHGVVVRTRPVRCSYPPPIRPPQPTPSGHGILRICPRRCVGSTTISTSLRTSTAARRWPGRSIRRGAWRPCCCAHPKRVYGGAMLAAATGLALRQWHPDEILHATGQAL